MQLNRIGNNGFETEFKAGVNQNWEMIESSINQLNSPGNITSEKIAANSITPFDLINEDTINLFNRLKAVPNAILLNDGTIMTKSDCNITEFIPVKEGEIYSVTASYSSQGGYFNSSYNWVQPVAPAVSQQIGGYKITVPSGVSYMRLNTLDPAKFMIVRGNKYPDRYYVYGEKFSLNWINKDVESLPKQIVNMENIAGANAINMFDKNVVTSNKYIDNNGNILDSTIISISDYISVIGGSTYTVSVGYSSQGGIYDKNKIWIGAIPHPSGTTNQPATFILPKNACYVRINVVNGILGAFMMVPGSVYPSAYTSFGVSVSWIKSPTNSYETKSKWMGKTVNILGDSNSAEDNQLATKRYFNYIAEEKGIVKVNNYGISGSTIAYTDVAPTRQDYAAKRYVNMTNDADLIIAFIGVNDFGKSSVLGVFSDRVDTTFYGACHILFSGLIDKYPDKTIVYFTPLQQTSFFPETNNHGRKLIDYVNAAVEVCEFYSIPVLNLYKMSGLYPYNEKHRTLYIPDGLHLNDASHKRIGLQKMSPFLEII